MTNINNHSSKISNVSSGRHWQLTAFHSTFPALKFCRYVKDIECF